MNVFKILSVVPITSAIALLIFKSSLPTHFTEKYFITKSKYDNVDMTEFDVNRGGELYFEFQNGELKQFTNFSALDTTISYGKIADYIADTIKDSKSDIKEYRSNFKWTYKNNYDLDSGTAIINMIQKTSPYSTDYYLKMTIPKTKEIIEYWGYKAGTRKNLIPETKFK